MFSNFNSKDVLLVLGSNIRKAREMRDYGIADLATSIHYDRGCLASLENGEQNVEYATILNLARKLNVPFPALFSRNFLYPSTDNDIDFSGPFKQDDYLFIFVENFQRAMKRNRLTQIDVYGETELQTAMLSRIVNHKNLNPTIKTLYAMSYTVDIEMYILFSRNTRKELPV